MSINFDEIIDRRGTSCLKYDFAVERGYPKDVLPFWVADMDFRAPVPVIDALTARTRRARHHARRRLCHRHRHPCLYCTE